MNSVGKMGNLWEPDCAPSSPTKPLRQRFWKERWGNHFSSLLRRLAFRSLVSVVPVFSIWRVSTLLLILQWCLSDLPSKTSDLYTGKYGNPVCTRWDQLINPQKNLQQHLITFATVVMWGMPDSEGLGWDESGPFSLNVAPELDEGKSCSMLQYIPWSFLWNTWNNMVSSVSSKKSDWPQERKGENGAVLQWVGPDGAQRLKARFERAMAAASKMFVFGVGIGWRKPKESGELWLIDYNWLHCNGTQSAKDLPNDSQFEYQRTQEGEQPSLSVYCPSYVQFDWWHFAPLEVLLWSNHIESVDFVQDSFSIFQHHQPISSWGTWVPYWQLGSFVLHGCVCYLAAIHVAPLWSTSDHFGAGWGAPNPCLMTCYRMFGWSRFAVFRPLKYARFFVAIATSSSARNPIMEVVEGSASYGGCDYDAIAAQYDSLHKDPESPQGDLAIAGFLREYLAPGCKVLDLGCGTGLLLELLALQPEDYLGIDPSEKMLEELQKKFPEHETKKKAFGVEDLEDVDVAVSLFGPISYVDPDLVFQLVSSGVNYFLMFYKEDYRPMTYDTCQVHPYPFQRYNLPSQDFGSFSVVTNLRTPDGSLAFPRQSLRRAERAKTEPSGVKFKPSGGLSAELESYSSDRAVLLKGHGNAKGSSLGETIVTMLNAYMGSGILVLPYAWKQAGWLYVLPFLAVTMMLSFTLRLMGILFRLVDARANEMNVPMVSRDWGMLGQMAFGRCGQLLFSGCALVDLYGGLLSGVIVASNQLQFLFPSLSAAVLSVGCFGVLLILVCVQARHFSSLAVVGLGSMLIIVSCLLITGGELVGLGEAAEDQVMVNWAGLAPAAGVAIYTFMVHSEAALVYQLMEDRSQWGQAVLCSTGLAAAFFVALAMLCYSFFGDGTAQSFPMNLGRSPLNLQLLPGELNGAMSALCLISVTLKLLLNVPLLAAPILEHLEECFHLGCWTKVLFSLVTACLCLFLHDDAAFVIELVGIMPQNFMCAVLPCAALLKLHGDLGGFRSCILWLLIVSFAIYGLGATVAAVLENVSNQLGLDVA